MKIFIKLARVFCLGSMLMFSIDLSASELNSVTLPVANYQLSPSDQKIYDNALTLINQFNGKGDQFETAYKMLLDLSKRNPISGYPYAGLADLKYRLATMGDGDKTEAYTLAQRAIKMDPSIADAYVVIAKVMVDKQNINIAREAANKAIAISPNKPEAMFAMGRVAEASLKYDEAESWYRKMIDIYKDNIRKANIYARLGEMLGNKTPKDIPGATAAYSKAAELNFDDGPWTLNNAGVFLIKNTDQYDQAIGYFQQALKIMEFRMARENLGLAEYYKWGDALLRPEKYSNAKRKPLVPKAITANTGVTSDYAFSMNACVSGNPTATLAMLKVGMVKNVDVSPDGTNTALICASAHDHLELAKQLIAKGANVNAEALNSKMTPLEFAVRQSNLDMVKLLVENGARVNHIDNSGYSVTSYSLNQKVGKPASILDYLLAHGANPTIPDKNGIVLIVNAVSGNDVEAVRLLANKYHADVNAKYDKTSILDSAATGTNWAGFADVAKSKEIVEILLKAGANPWIRDGNGTDLLSILTGPWSENKACPTYKVTAPLIAEARKHFPKPANYDQEFKSK